MKISCRVPGSDSTLRRHFFITDFELLHNPIPSLKANRKTSLRRWRQRWFNLHCKTIWNPFNDLHVKKLSHLHLCKSTTFWCKNESQGKKFSRKKSLLLLIRSVGDPFVCLMLMNLSHPLPFLMLCADPGRNSALKEVHLIMQISFWKKFCFIFESSSATTTSSKYFNNQTMHEIERKIFLMNAKQMKPDVLRFLFTNTHKGKYLFHERCVGTKKGFLIRDLRVDDEKKDRKGFLRN